MPAWSQKFKLLKKNVKFNHLSMHYSNTVWKVSWLSKIIPLRRFKATDIPGSVAKGAPDFCSVYVISKGKIQSMRSASRPAPPSSPFRSHLINQSSIKSDAWDPNLHQSTTPKKGQNTFFFKRIAYSFFLFFSLYLLSHFSLINK